MSVTGNQILTFSFIKRKFIIVGSEVIELEGITSFTNRQLLDEQNCSTGGNEVIFGKNLIDVDVPKIGTILYNEVLSPFHVFQLFSIILWMSFVRIWLIHSSFAYPKKTVKEFFIYHMILNHEKTHH